MRVSQLLHAMCKDDIIEIDDYDLPIYQNTIYRGTVRGIERDNPINKMHIKNLCFINDKICVLAQKPKEKV